MRDTRYSDLGSRISILEIRWPRWAQALPGYTVGTLGAYWTVQRLALMIAG